MKKHLLLLALFIWGISVPAAKAATINWLGGTSAWNTAANWSTGTVPTNADAVQIGVVPFTGIQPIISSSAVCSSLTIGNSTTVTLTVNAALAVTNTITVTSGTINSNASGTISAANISLFTAILSLNGTLTVSGVLQTPTPGTAPANSTMTTNGAGNTISGGIAVHTGTNLNWNGSGTTTCGASTVFSSTTLTVGAGNNINFTGGLTINESTTPGYLVNSGNLTFTSSTLSTGNATVLTDVIVNNAGANITLSGTNPQISLGGYAGLSNSGTITAGSTSTFGSSNPSRYTNNLAGVMNLAGTIFNLNSSNCTLSNSGNINFSATSVVNTGNPVTITNNSGGSITVTASKVILSGGTNLTNSGSIAFSSSSSFTTNNPVVITNNSSASLTFAASTVTFNSGTTINNSGTIGASAGTTMSAAGNPVPINNNSTGTFSLTGSTLTMAAGSYIANAGAVSMTTSTANFTGNPAYINNSTNASSLTVSNSILNLAGGCFITNSGTVNTNTSSTINLNGNPASITNNVGGQFNASATAFNLVAGSSITNTGGTFSTTSGSSFILNGNPSTITNQNSGATVGTFNGSNTAFTFNGSNSFVNSGITTLNAGSSITMASGSNSCAVTNSGSFYAGTSNSACTINLSGSASNVTNTGTFYEGSTSVINPNGASATVKNNSGTFTLQSDANGSATIATLSGTASCTGTFNVERFLSGGTGHRGYRLLSSPVYAATLSAGGNYNVYNINYLQTSIYLTGTSTTGGFDNIAPANPTLYLMRENLMPAYTTFLNSNFIGISKINNSPNYGYTMNDATYTGIYNIPVGSGILCFFRGDRSTSFANKTTAPYPVPENTTLTAIGTLNTGTIAARNWFTAGTANLSRTSGMTYAGYNLVGNPYPSSIDWDTFSSSTATAPIYGPNLTGIISLLNPNGSYGNYSAVTHLGSNNGTHIIPSGAGFEVQVGNTGTGSLTFREGAKVNTQVVGPSLFMSTQAMAAANTTQYLRLQMVMDTFYNEDIVINLNKNAKANFDIMEDAAYRAGSCKVSLNSISADGFALAINQVPFPDKSMSVGLNIGATASGTYTLNMQEIVRIPQLFDIWLMDDYKKDSVDMRHNALYRFDINKSDLATFGAHRFNVVIRQNQAHMYRLLNFTAVKGTGKQVQLTWTTENEANYTYFTVERSTDGGKTFKPIGGPASTGAGEYSFLDKNPADQNIYRLKQIDFNALTTYTNSIPIGFSNLINNLVSSSINLYPNPASTTINVAIARAIPNGATYNIRIVNSTGLVIKQAISTQGSWQSNVSDLLPGTYIVKIVDTKNNTYLGDAKFVKR